MAKATIEDVGRKAMSDAAFWKQLKADPDGALRSRDIQLDADALRDLKAVLAKGRVAVDLDHLLANLQRGQAQNWTGNWQGWPHGWINPGR
jgi:hypothetical protein